MDYDSNFKESPTYNGLFRSSNGYLEVSGVPDATAAFDTSASGGANGAGGTGGNDANNDLSDVTISADAASSVDNGIGIGFLFRMNSSEANGYLARVITQATTLVQFSIFEGAGLNMIGTQIFSSTVPLRQGTTLTANTVYPFRVSLTGGLFSFDFASGAATASFTDTTVSATTGQVGVVLSTIGPSAATRLDNFAIIPEPSSATLALLSGIGFLAFARNRFDSRITRT